jgi:tetratricopeptide (TPR) repeat protein
MTPEDIAEHNRLYRRAMKLAEGELLLQGGRAVPALSKSGRSKLDEALLLLEDALRIHPSNWATMWLIGKIYQRIGDYHAALTWFARVQQMRPAQADVAREASLCAMALGRSEEGLQYAQRALEASPRDAGLSSNLALAWLLANKLDEAKREITRAVALKAADDGIKLIKAMIDHFIANGNPPPRTTGELTDYWRSRG